MGHHQLNVNRNVNVVSLEVTPCFLANSLVCKNARRKGGCGSIVKSMRLGLEEST